MCVRFMHLMVISDVKNLLSSVIQAAYRLELFGTYFACHRHQFAM
jgi:hypothetical protein